MYSVTCGLPARGDELALAGGLAWPYRTVTVGCETGLAFAGPVVNSNDVAGRLLSNKPTGDGSKQLMPPGNWVGNDYKI